MNTVVSLKTFNTAELFHLLKSCAHNLAIAYQTTQEKSLYLASEEAYDACNYLMYEMQKQLNTQTIH